MEINRDGLSINNYFGQSRRQLVDRSITYVVSLLAGTFLFLCGLLAWNGVREYTAYQETKQLNLESQALFAKQQLERRVKDQISIVNIALEEYLNDQQANQTETGSIDDQSHLRKLSRLLDLYVLEADEYLLLDLQGNVISNFQKHTSSTEIAFIRKAIQAQSFPPYIFAHWLEDDPKVYTCVQWFDPRTAERTGYLIVSQPAMEFVSILGERFAAKGYRISLSDGLTGRTYDLISNEVATPALSASGSANALQYEILNTNWVVSGEIDALPLQDIVINSMLAGLSWLLFYVVVSAFLLSLFWKEVRTRREINEEHQNLTQRIEGVLGAIGDSVFVTSLDGRLIYANNNAEQEFNHGRSLEGKSLWDIFPDSDATRLMQESVMLANDKNYVPRCDMVLRRDQQKTFYELNSSLLSQQDLEAVVWSMRDVSTNRLALAELDASQRRYKTIFQGAGVALLVVDFSRLLPWLSRLGDHFSEESATELISSEFSLKDEFLSKTQIIEVNEAAVQLFHADSREDALNHLPEIYTLQGEPLELELIKALLQGKPGLELEGIGHTMEGGEIQLWINVSLASGQNRYDYVLISLLDITLRKAMEKAISEREAFWSTILNASPDIIYVNEYKSRRNLYINRSIDHYLGYAVTNQNNSERATSWLGYLHPQDQAKYQDYWQQLRVLRVGSCLESILRLQDVQGHWRYFRNRDTVLSVCSNGEIENYVGVIHEITEQVNSQKTVAKSEQKYRLLANNTRDVIWTVDESGKINFVSPSVEFQLGYTAEDILDKQVRDDICGPKYVKEIEQASIDIFSGKKESEVLEVELRHKDGHEVFLEVQFSPIRDELGNLTGSVAVSRDISERRHAQQELQLTAAVFENSAESIYIIDQQGDVQRINQAFSRVTGYEPEEVVGRPTDIFRGDNVSREQMKQVMETLQREGKWQGEAQYKHRDGNSYPCWLSMSVVQDVHGKGKYYVGMFIDTSEQKASEERIQYLAYYDALTGLPNRSLFHDRLNGAIHHAQRHNACVGLLLLDLDRFKPINDSFGHPVGDQLLKLVAKRLLSCVQEDDTVARLGGDEFAIVINDLDEPKQAVNQISSICDRILSVIAEPFMLSGKEVFTTVSIGAVVCPEDGTHSTELIRKVDTAMYHSKNEGKNNYQFYAEEMNAQAMERLVLENAMHHALKNEEFEIYYQPQFNARSRQLVGMEALVRWRHPERGIIQPGKFIPLAEETGLIVSIGVWVLEHACAQWVAWYRQGYQLGRLSVNLSGRQFKDEQVQNCIIDILERTGMDPAMLEIELTESILMEDVELTNELLHNLKNRGIRVSVDDFGTGYSSMNYLKQFPIDVLKIDRSFIRSLPGQREDEQITLAIIAIAHAMQMSVIAEGVETEDQLEFLAQHDCDVVQGFFFSGPLACDEFTQYLDKTIHRTAN